MSDLAQQMLARQAIRTEQSQRRREEKQKRQQQRPLEEVKVEACRRIDQQTAREIAQGFLHNGRRFSASRDAQLKWVNLTSVSDNLSYPMLVSTLTDTETVSLADSAAVVEMQRACAAHVATTVARGAARKQRVHVAKDAAELTAILTQ